jgi:hypothetical protein
MKDVQREDGQQKDGQQDDGQQDDAQQGGPQQQRCSFFLRAEQAGQKAIRNDASARKCLVPFFLITAVSAFLVPFFLTGEITLRGARDVCLERFKVGSPVAEKHRQASYQLTPSHIFSAVASVLSTVCFLLWAFYSPHRSTSASTLDQKRTCCRL